MDALFGDKDWLMQLNTSQASSIFWVHSVFNRTINLIDEKGELYTLAAKSVANAPNTLVFDVPDMASIHANQGMMVIGEKQHFNLSGKKLYWSTTCPVDVRIPVFHSFDIDNACCLCLEALATQEPPSNAFEVAVYQQLGSYLEQLAQYSTWQDSAKVEVLLRNCIGLGIGLTPSGDDALLGLCTLIAPANSPIHSLLVDCQRVITSAHKQTNPISYAALCHGINGKFNQVLIHFINSMFTNNSTEIRQQLQLLLAIGSTSGADMLRGIYTGLLLIKSRSEHYAYQNSH